MFAQRQKPIDFAAEGLRLALSVDRNCGIRVDPDLRRVRVYFVAKVAKQFSSRPAADEQPADETL